MLEKQIKKKLKKTSKSAFASEASIKETEKP